MEAMTEAIEQQHCTMGDVHASNACVHHHPLVPAESTKREKQKSKEHTATLCSNRRQYTLKVRCTRRGSSEFEQE